MGICGCGICTDITSMKCNDVWTHNGITTHICLHTEHVWNKKLWQWPISSWICGAYPKNHAHILHFYVFCYRLTLGDFTTMWCCYNTVNFLQNPPKRHPTAHPCGWGMGCILWDQTELCSAVLYVIQQKSWQKRLLHPGMMCLFCDYFYFISPRGLRTGCLV